MINDPYSTLGVSPNATDDEIKSSYRNLARKYHPDNFASDPQKRAEAEEKMKEINEAYDQIQSMRRGAGNSYGGTSRNTNDTSSNRERYILVREYINSGRIDQADMILEQIDQYDRGAEWNFLKGCVSASKGWYFEAQNYFARACSMDPQNIEYRSALNNMQNAARGFNSRGYTTANSSECSGCDICGSLLCADCMCENCCGGDIVPCC